MLIGKLWSDEISIRFAAWLILSGLFEYMVDSVCIGVHTRKKNNHYLQGNIGLNGENNIINNSGKSRIYQNVG